MRLEPLERAHALELWPAADEEGLWAYMTFDVRSRHELARWVAARVQAGEAGTALPFLERDASTRAAIGSTSIFDIDREHGTMEIGHTWLARSHRRTAVNTEAKLMLLGHCFGALGARRVQFKTDARNERSRLALARIGAVFEGVLRKQRVNPDGHVRDAAVFSILDDEWPAVRDHLDGLLRTARSGDPTRQRAGQQTS